MTQRKRAAVIGNASDEGQQDDGRRVMSERAQLERSDFAALLGTPQGRRVFARLIQRCGVMRTPFAGEATHVTAFQCGEQNIGLELSANAERYVPELYRLMREEAANQENQ